ncbi:hypothetical protein XM57_27130 [Burkholderia cepacia]|nr:hypothetical protein XM57_27130 [Burkholderia cepacia]AYZ95094.1 hypothetical protein EGY28_08655 [Burkholderia dolosa]PRE49785.1 hypothetical protein C6P87_12455 [Burkholderia sp. AU12872]
MGVPAGAGTFGRIVPIAQCVRPSAGDTRVATARFASPWLRKRVDCAFECRDPTRTGTIRLRRDGYSKRNADAGIATIDWRF